ncbi:MAG: cupin domain-containing protein [Candidatus Eisenbacteria bacterium]|uniref:Cupin domain-containing protein n=1 Tax=Eiseniibacteriota bacterium TaxID=2212470 RepID=A0A956N8E3_UNCEI|nr:cupin domain-containing protein [Candidatus Eisenbacteria bacterium]
MARIGNVTAPGRYTLGAWKEQTAKYTQQQLERQVISTDRITVVRCSYPAGSDFCLHFHPQEQITIVESGTLVFEIEGETLEVSAGKMIAIPAGVRHRTRVDDHPAQALHLFVPCAESKEAASRPQMARV